ncbi:hypothetical protein SHKM778_77810 [Streptomyces sp. KM77-8]|uniref:Glycosyltransferase 2-like domain-containing protein n=1 Tax=Streptomyces haneummycinicus TaxID=3074435 RepID=A0AAT9HVV3_9ACTN
MSVICPTYNRSRPILDTIASVRAQTVSDWELLVVSDGSTDDTDHWVREAARADSRVRLLRTERHGHPSGPRNHGLTQARGGLVAYLDHDDQWHPDHLEVLLTAFDDGAELISTGFELRDAHGTVVASSEPYDLCWHPEIQTLGVVFEPSRVAHRRGLAETAGGWQSGGGLEDWDLWLRMTDAGARFTTVPHRTARLLNDPGTRRHRIPHRHRLPVAAFDDPRKARAVLDHLQHKRNEAALRQARTQDIRAWMTRLVNDPDFTRPAGWNGDPVKEAEARLSRAPAPCAGLVLVRERHQYVLAQPLLVSTAGHARRIQRLSRQTQPNLLALIDAIAGAA